MQIAINHAPFLITTIKRSVEIGDSNRYNNMAAIHYHKVKPKIDLVSQYVHPNRNKLKHIFPWKLRELTLFLMKGVDHETSAVGGRGVSSVDKRVFRPHFLVQKLRIIRNLWCVRTDKKGEIWDSADVLQTKGEAEGVNFSQFCADLFCGWPLMCCVQY